MTTDQYQHRKQQLFSTIPTCFPNYKRLNLAPFAKSAARTWRIGCINTQNFHNLPKLSFNNLCRKLLPGKEPRTLPSGCQLSESTSGRSYKMASGSSPAQANGDDSSGPVLRRSGRARKTAMFFGDEDPETQPTPSKSPSTELQLSMSTRRNPKRKAAPREFDLPDNMLEASLDPWEENEQNEWHSWTELESDPVSCVPNHLFSAPSDKII